MLETGLLVLAALMVGTAKGGMASAGAMAVPMLALFMSPLEAAALLLPVYIVTDMVAVWLYRRDFSAPNLRIFLPAMLVGIALATLISPVTPEAALLVFTGCIGLWYCLRAWLSPAAAPAPLAQPLPGLFWGTVAGVTTFISHSGAPPAQAYLLPQRLKKLDFAGTMALSFAAANLAKLPAYGSIGLFEGLDWGLAVALAAAGCCGTGIGRWLTTTLPEALYLTVVQALLFLLSCVLLVRGGSALLTG